jgi:hypothetical protein
MADEKKQQPFNKNVLIVAGLFLLLLIVSQKLTDTHTS